MELVNGLPILNKKSEKENIANIFFNLGKTVGFWQKEKENVARDKEFTAQQTALLEQARAQLQQQMQLLASLMIGIQAQNNQLKQVNPPYPPLNIGGGQPAEVPPPSPNNPPIPPRNRWRTLRGYTRRTTSRFNGGWITSPARNSR